MLTASAIHEIHGHLLTDDEIAAMRFWIADCARVDLTDDDVADMSRADIVAGIEQHYADGVAAFMRSLHAELGA